MSGSTLVLRFPLELTPSFRIAKGSVNSRYSIWLAVFCLYFPSNKVQFMRREITLTQTSKIIAPFDVARKVGGYHTGVKAVGEETSLPELRGQGQREEHVGSFRLPVCYPLIVGFAILCPSEGCR